MGFRYDRILEEESSVNLKTLAISAGMTALAFSLAPFPASAAPKETSLFSSESNAKSVCGDGKVVWAVIDTGKYYRPGTPGYEWGKGERKGAYTCESHAKARGFELAKTVS
jgi:hypothetical protein